MGAQQAKSVNTSSAIRLATVRSERAVVGLWLLIEQYIDT